MALVVSTGTLFLYACPPTRSLGLLTFKVTTSVLFALSLASVFGRFYIRLRVQKQFSIDDVFLIFGTCCLICAVAILFVLMDSMYLTQALTYGEVDFELPPDIVTVAYWYRKMSAVSLILSWLTIASVKFCFLALFKKLIDRMPRLITYWWCVVAFNLAVTGYGAAVYILACPYFYSIESRKSSAYPHLDAHQHSLMSCPVKCATGGFEKRAVHYSLSQMILDIVGDAMSKISLFEEIVARVADCVYSRLHPNSSHLENSNQVGSEISFGLFALSHSGDDRHDCDSGVRN